MKKYTKEKIAEMIEDYKSLVNSLSQEWEDRSEIRVLGCRKDKDGYHNGLILPKRIYLKNKEKIEFIDKCIPLIKNPTHICVLEARIKNLENKNVKQHFDISSRQIVRLFEQIVNTFYESEFNDK